MAERPFTHRVRFPHFVPDACDNHVVRRLSDMKGQFNDEKTYDSLVAHEDTLLYEVYEFSAARLPGGLFSGVSVLHCGLVGDEYFMTKGHFHEVLDTAEVYHCLAGRGMMVMETPEGQTAVEELEAGVVLYVPPRWAHRSVNTLTDHDLVTLFVYPANAGHDYGTIESSGFRKLVVMRDGAPCIVDNPKWAEPSR